jgi:hypothetical protein
MLQRAFPDNGHTPAKGPKLLNVSPVTIHVAHEFPLPELLVGLRACRIAATFVSMPEAAVNENNCPVPWKDKIRRAGKPLAMKSIAKSSGK